MIEKILEKIGLSANEVKVYLAALKLQSAPASHIAHEARIPRTTAYSLLQELQSKGFITKHEQKEITEYSALDPELLVSMLERRKNEIDAVSKEIKNVLPMLTEMKAKNVRLPSVRFFEGIEGIKQAYEDTLENNEDKFLYTFTGTESIYDVMSEAWVDYYLNKRVEKGIEVQSIAPDTSQSKKQRSKDKKLLRVMKLIPQEFDFGSEIDIYDDKVSIFSFSKDRPFSVFIEDRNIAKSLKQIFRYMFQELSD